MSEKMRKLRPEICNKHHFVMPCAAFSFFLVVACLVMGLGEAVWP